MSTQYKTKYSSQVPRSRGPPGGSRTSRDVPDPPPIEFNEDIFDSNTSPSRRRQSRADARRQSGVTFASSIAPSESVSRVKSSRSRARGDVSSRRMSSSMAYNLGSSRFSGMSSARDSRLSGQSGPALTESNLEALTKQCATQREAKKDGYDDLQTTRKSKRYTVDRDGYGGRSDDQELPQSTRQTSRWYRTSNNNDDVLDGPEQSRALTLRRGSRAQQTQASSRRRSVQDATTVDKTASIPYEAVSSSQRTREPSAPPSANVIDINRSQSQRMSTATSTKARSKPIVYAAAQESESNSTAQRSPTQRAPTSAPRASTTQPQSRAAVQSRTTRRSRRDNSDSDSSESTAQQSTQQRAVIPLRTPKSPSSAGPPSSMTMPVGPMAPGGMWKETIRVVRERGPNGREFEDRTRKVQRVGA